MWYYSHVRYCLRYCSRHYSHRRINEMALTDDVALTDEVSRFYWTKILTYCWSVTWQHISGPKIVRILHAYTQDNLQPNRVTVQTVWSNLVLLTDDVAQSWASEMFLIRWLWFTQCIYKKEALPPNLVSLNSFLSSIFCNSFSILYFLCILINFHFAPSLIMSS